MRAWRSCAGSGSGAVGAEEWVMSHMRMNVHSHMAGLDVCVKFDSGWLVRTAAWKAASARRQGMKNRRTVTRWLRQATLSLDRGLRASWVVCRGRSLAISREVDCGVRTPPAGEVGG